MSNKTHWELATTINKEGQNKQGRTENKEMTYSNCWGGCQPRSLYQIKIVFKNNSDVNTSQEKKRKTISELKEI